MFQATRESLDSSEAELSANGTCKLCRRNGVELKDSHLLPANIYRKIRRCDGANNSLVVLSKKSFRFTDRQINDHLLCGECEQRFGEVENWVSRQCLQDDGSFPLRDAVVHYSTMILNSLQSQKRRLRSMRTPMVTSLPASCGGLALTFGVKAPTG